MVRIQLENVGLVRHSFVVRVRITCLLRAQLDPTTFVKLTCAELGYIMFILRILFGYLGRPHATIHDIRMYYI